ARARSCEIPVAGVAVRRKLDSLAHTSSSARAAYFTHCARIDDDDLDSGAGSSAGEDETVPALRDRQDDGDRSLPLVPFEAAASHARGDGACGKPGCVGSRAG